MREIEAIPGQSRGGRVRVYVCCCPFMLLLAPVMLAGRVARYGILRLVGRSPGALWPTPAVQTAQHEGYRQ